MHITLNNENRQLNLRMESENYFLIHYLENIFENLKRKIRLRKILHPGYFI